MNSFNTAFRLALVTSIFVALNSEGYTQDQIRQWSSRDATETIEARFQSYDPVSRLVSLQLAAGDSLDVHLRQLSRADQRYVIKEAKNRLQDQQPDSEHPTEVKEPLDSTKGERSRQKNRNSKSLNTQTAFGIHWTPGIQSALKSAEGRETPADDRPVMWLRVLGDLGGFM